MQTVFGGYILLHALTTQGVNGFLQVPMLYTL